MSTSRYPRFPLNKGKKIGALNIPFDLRSKISITSFFDLHNLNVHSLLVAANSFTSNKKPKLFCGD